MELNLLEFAALELARPLTHASAEGLQSALMAIQGVHSVEAVAGGATAALAYDASRVKPQQLRLAAHAVGCGVTRIVLPGTEALERPSRAPARVLVAGA